MLDNATPNDLIALWGALITIFSVLANFIPKETVVGKVIHWFALNFKTTGTNK